MILRLFKITPEILNSPSPFQIFKLFGSRVSCIKFHPYLVNIYDLIWKRQIRFER
jgi:hypothetical protein